MRFFHSWKNVPPAFQNAVVAVGNFDGFHAGHRAVVEKAAEIGRELDRPVVLMTFEPHPETYFRAALRPFRLTPVRAKVRAITTLPVDAFFVLPFNKTLAEMSAETFVDEVLINGLHAAHLVVGDDFGFGRGRAGSVGFLRKNHPELPLTAVAKVRDAAGETVSSSRIRAFIADGKVDRAAALTGRPFEIEGRVVHGFKRGRTIGFPTINIEPADVVVPKLGVYAGLVVLDGTDRPALVNIGTRPTVGGTNVLLEAHILDYSGDLYGRRLRVKLVRFVRPERKFDDLQALKAQIVEDTETIKRILA